MYDQSLYEPRMPKGLPRPVCRVKRMPVPWNVDLYEDGTPLFSCTHKHRVELSECYHLCQVCGKRLYKNAVFVVDDIGSIVDRAGLHRRCARLAFAHCPHLKDPGNPNWNMPGTLVAIYADVQTVMKIGEAEERLLLPVWDEAPKHMRGSGIPE